MSNRPFGISPLARHPNPSGLKSASSTRHQQESDHISDQLVQLGLLNPRDVAAGRARRSGKKEIPTGPGAAEAYPKKNTSVTKGTGLVQPARRPSSVESSNSKASSRANDLKGRSGGGMTGMLDTDRSRTRRDRTFVGSECAVCEEPLEHTLRGERILQFSCGHVSHGACFYEYMKEFDSQYCPECSAPLGLDTSRGGNEVDIEKLSSMARAVSMNDRTSATPTPTQWDNQTVRPPSQDSSRPYEREREPSRQGRESAASHRDRNTRDSRDRDNIDRDNIDRDNRDRDNRDRDSRDRGSRDRDSRDRDSRDRNSRDTRDTRDRYTQPTRGHQRSDSEATGQASSNGYPETALSGPSRRHDFDAQSMDASLMSPRSSVSRNPIPPPIVSVRSEFPTLNRSRTQQTLTCLITVEVPDNKWRPDPDDFRAPPVPMIREEERYARPPSPAKSVPRFYPYESPEVLEEMTESLRSRVENWHGLDFQRFGKLRLCGTIRVGKDKVQWQELECYLFAEMLICVKEKKGTPLQQWSDEGNGRRINRCTLKGSILIRKHLDGVTQTSSGDTLGMTQKITSSNLRPQEENILTLSLSVAELPQFHLQFEDLNQLKLWQQALLDLHSVDDFPPRIPEDDRDISETEEEDWRRIQTNPKRVSSLNSSYAGRSATTAPTEYTNHRSTRLPTPIHVPVDIVVVIPISSSMQGVKITLVRDALNYMVQNLGERDRMGLVTFGSGGGGVPLVGMTTKTWSGWQNVLSQIRPVGQKIHRADVVEGANVAMDLLMQRKSNNPIATILLISDSSTSDQENVDFVVSRAEAAKIAIHSFGLGMTHKPDTMIELSTRTKASYTYVKDWMMLRECLAGCLGSLQTTSHQNVKLKLRLPEGSPAKFVKISGALQITRRATGRDAEAALGDLRFGDKRDILVQLVITPDASSPEQLPSDPWETIMSNLEALSDPLDADSPRVLSIEEVPLIQADLTWGDILRDNTTTHLPRPSLLAITMLPAPTPSKKSAYPATPPIPPHPSVVQRRMELLTSDMLTRALTLVSRGQHERAAHLLTETRSILKGLGKGGLPPVPNPNNHHSTSIRRSPQLGGFGEPGKISPATLSPIFSAPLPPPLGPPPAAPLSPAGNAIGTTAAGIDAAVVEALDAELEASLEWIHHPAVFGRDSRKAVLQAIGVISSQRAWTMRTRVEWLWAGRVGGVKRGLEGCRMWREPDWEGGLEGVREES